MRKPSNRNEYLELAEWMSKHRFLACIDCGCEWIDTDLRKPRLRCVDCGPEYKKQTNRAAVARWRERQPEPMGKDSI